jgi:hypothetical protein
MRHMQRAPNESHRNIDCCPACAFSKTTGTSHHMKTTLRWIAYAIALMLTTILPAYALETVGPTTVGAHPSGALSPNYKRVSKVTLTEPGVLQSISIFLEGAGTGQSGYQPVSAVMYTDNNGVPGTKVFQSDTLMMTPDPTPTWYAFDSPLIPLPPGNYWIGIHSGGPVALVRDRDDGSSATNWYGNADNYNDEASGTFGPGSPGTGTLSIFATYYPADQYTAAGRASIAATPSGGMSANFKRGSRITLSERGRVTHLSAYLDSLGGTAGTQSVRLALYRDAGGVPRDLVLTTEEITLSAGSPGQWRTASINGAGAPELDAGDYWVIIHSGGTAGVIRNFGDGAANWYGNADTYSDGSSAPFGAGNTGTVTISATALYVPANVASIKFGRKTVGSTPSGGLAANYMRGSSFGGSLEANDGPTTALWAYLDGLGGASGSQQVRMALYELDQYGSAESFKRVESEVVTIAAGTPPGWVRFPITKPVTFGFAPTYYIAIESGPTGGVVRDYGGDGWDTWVGEAVTFSTSAPDIFPHRGATSGTGTLSVYLEYSAHH